MWVILEINYIQWLLKSMIFFQSVHIGLLGGFIQRLLFLGYLGGFMWRLQKEFLISNVHIGLLGGFMWRLLFF
jgi:hypothetical protein